MTTRHGSINILAVVERSASNEPMVYLVGTGRTSEGRGIAMWWGGGISHTLHGEVWALHTGEHLRPQVREWAHKLSTGDIGRIVG